MNYFGGVLLIWVVDNPFFISNIDQLWKLDGTALKSKANVWTSNDEWNIKNKCIQNISKQKVLGTAYDGKVIEEEFTEGKFGQLWIKGEPNNEGYFTLRNPQSQKVMTAISATGLEMKGNL